MIFAGHENIAKIFIERGVNLSEKNNDGDTPLNLAVSKGNLNTII